MKYKSVFDRVAKNAGLLPEEIQPATAWFSLGVEAAEGNAKQKPVLLTEAPVFQAFQNKLSQAEVMSLRASVAHSLTIMHKDLLELKQIVNELYDECDKDKPETYKSFTLMNKYRDTIRVYKKEIKRFAAIQKKLKAYV